MILNPFPLLRRFEDRLSVGLFAKGDDMQSDAKAARAVGASSAVGLWQEHGNTTVVVRESSDRTIRADGMLTDVPGLALCLRVADCQSFVVYAPERSVCGLLHVGWKGLIAGAIPEFFAVMQEQWGIGGTDVFVAAGPSLCKKCADFTDPERELPTVPKHFIDGKHVDLQGAATAGFLAIGVREDHFERSSDCTRCDPKKYWTYRGGDREAVKTGHSNMVVCALKRI